MEILHTSNGIAPSTRVEPVRKQHLDMHHKHVMDESLMMESGAIMISMDTTMVTLLENVDLHVLFVYIYSPKPSR
jgi:hypothetical protein